jgi:broad specificity phosphatase PhoE
MFCREIVLSAANHTHLYLIRHGETESNRNELLHGATDVPLNETGEAQAELVGERIAQTLTVDRLYASPLQRALRTAMAISRRTGLEPIIMPGLAEMHFGAAEGVRFHDLVELFPEEFPRFLDLSDSDVRYPDGESRREFLSRVRQSIDQIVDESPGLQVVAVAHGGVIAAALAMIFNENPADWRRYSIKNCSVTHIEFAQDGPISHLMNDVVHLEQFDLTAGGGR